MHKNSMHLLCFYFIREWMLVLLNMNVSPTVWIECPFIFIFFRKLLGPSYIDFILHGRGSLFKILHKNNQPLDIRRLLRMALDVVRFLSLSLSLKYTHKHMLRASWWLSEPSLLQCYESHRCCCRQEVWIIFITEIHQLCIET